MESTLSKRIQSSKQAKPTFDKMPKSAGIEGGPFEIKKIFLGPKLYFGGMEHFLYLVPNQKFWILIGVLAWIFFSSTNKSQHFLAMGKSQLYLFTTLYSLTQAKSEENRP